MAAEEIGTHLFEYNNAQGNNPVEAFRVPSIRVSVAALAVTDWSTVNFRPRLQANAANLWVTEGGTITWKFKNAAADTLESEESSLNMGLVLRNLRSKVEQKILISSNDLDAFKSSGTDDIVGSTTDFIKLGSYDVPNGFAARIDSSEIMHAYVGDDT